MKRNASQIWSQRGQKYEIDRVPWTTYANFHDMYTHNYTEMVKAGVVRLLDNPEWQNKKGRVRVKSERMGAKLLTSWTTQNIA